ncbi:glycosyltransferase family 2 protein [Sulfuriferula sp. AH1]|uniref:glycosyltransferase family 2 protein n=1 Tax=Sulfuriferula sp. AH1 TaxID=1985873 RepID=UPI0012F76DF6|nr:glycosyltransferase family 2 protein [Sulfuriferula sp. AH1]
MPKISVVIPTYNRAAYLDAAIASVLAQRGADFEIIVSDNCSQDETAAVVGKYLADSRVRYHRNEENIGMVRNWRKAVFEHASGDWFVLLSDDDYLVDPDYLAKASRLIEDNPSVVVVYAEGYMLNESTGEQKPIVLPFEGVVKGVDVFLSRGTIKPQDLTLCNIVFNRSMAAELNAFSDPDNIFCDSELFLKLTLLGDVGVVKGPVSVYRFHPGNLMKSVNKSPNLIYGNLDHLVAPYMFAKGRVTPEQLAIFRKNTKLDRYVGNSLLRLAHYSWDSYHIRRQEIAGKIPEVIKAITRSPRFWIKLLFARFGS